MVDITKGKVILDALHKEGYKITDIGMVDYGRTVSLNLEKDGKKYHLYLSECFYDTNKLGEITKFHGIIDIRDSEWYKKEKAIHGG